MRGVSECSFDDAAVLGRMIFTDPRAWRWDEGGHLELVGASDYQPPVRSPRSIALLPDRYGDFVLTARLKQTGREYGHRDLCLFFGFQSDSEFYYVHLASQPDPNAHNVFVVDGAPRRPLAPVPEAGVQWGDDWHEVRLEHRASEGRITVDFDGERILEATDDTFRGGRVGFGSFDDQGLFDDIRIEGECWPENTEPGMFRGPTSAE